MTVSTELDRVGLGQSDDGLGWIRSHKMDPRTTLNEGTGIGSLIHRVKWRHRIYGHDTFAIV